MDDDRLRTLRAWLDATPAETAGLALLLAGAVTAAGLVWWTSQPSRVTDGPGPAAVPTATAPVRLTIHVAGAVHRPGVVTLPHGARVTDAIDEAGGARPDAVLAALNLARLLEDGERVLVPSPDDPEVPAAGGAGERADGRVDLNRATAAQLEELPGIGPVLAQRIVAHREDHGPFTEVGDLREVPGIGERTFQSLAELVAV